MLSSPRGVCRQCARPRRCDASWASSLGSTTNGLKVTAWAQWGQAEEGGGGWPAFHSNSLPHAGQGQAKEPEQNGAQVAQANALAAAFGRWLVKEAP